MKDSHLKIEQYIDTHKDEAISFLQKVIRQPSLQGNEAGVQEIVIGKLKELNLTIDRWDPPHSELSKHAYFVESRKTYEGSPNVVGVLKAVA